MTGIRLVVAAGGAPVLRLADWSDRKLNLAGCRVSLQRMEPPSIEGLVAAVFTPMREDGEVDLARIPAIVDHLERSKIAGAYVLGTTGEGPSMTEEERRAVAEAYVEHCHDRMPVVVQVGHNSLKAAAKLAAHAEKIGADAISATPTGYFRAAGEGGLLAAMAEITRAAPKTPFYYYHIPSLSGSQMDPVRFTKLAREQLPTFCGIKYSDSGTLHNLPLLRKAGPDLEYFSGSDEGYLQALAQGYRAAVGSTYNFAAPLYHRVREAFEAGDLEEARLWQGRAMEMIYILLDVCGFSGLKAMMGIVGVDCGPVRRPVEPATGEHVAILRKRLDETGWFEWMNLREPAVS